MDTLCDITDELLNTLSDEQRAEMLGHIEEALRLSTIEAVLRMSFKLPCGGSEFRRRIFEVNKRG